MYCAKLLSFRSQTLLFLNLLASFANTFHAKLLVGISQNSCIPVHTEAATSLTDSVDRALYWTGLFNVKSGLALFNTFVPERLSNPFRLAYCFMTTTDVLYT